MELKNIKQEETAKVEVYYERIQKLAHGLQALKTNNFLTTMFKMGLQSYLKIVIARMKRSTLQQHNEAKMLCEIGMTTIEARSALSVP
jgi:negative regulator of genetic competence, sporulation and motility